MIEAITVSILVIGTTISIVLLILSAFREID